MPFRFAVASPLLIGLVAWPVLAADDSFMLIRQDDKVSVYSKRPESCVSDGANVLFLVENRSKERLELKLELLSQKVKTHLTVLVEPSGNTSVLSLTPDPEACKTQLVEMEVNSLARKGEKPETASVPGAKSQSVAQAETQAF